MACGSRSKSCYKKSCVRYYNNNPQAFAADQTLQLQLVGARVVDSGIAIDAQPMSYTVFKAGLYHLTADAVIDVTTLGSGTLQWYMDGVPLPCTMRTIRLPVGDSEVHTETDLELTGCCCDIEHNFTLVFTSSAAVGSVSQLCTGIVKLA